MTRAEQEKLDKNRNKEQRRWGERLEIGGVISIHDREKENNRGNTVIRAQFIIAV